jgi:hypothetical protein
LRLDAEAGAGERTRTVKAIIAAAMKRPVRTWVVALLAVVAGVSACVHLIDPRQAANTDIGLQVWAQVTPTELSVSDTISRIRIRINAKNPGQDTILVDNGGPTCDVQPDPAAGRGLLQSMRIADDTHQLAAGPGGDICGTTTLKFTPKKTRSWDFYVGIKQWKSGGYQVVTKEYRVRSYFAGYEGYSALFKLVP